MRRRGGRATGDGGREKRRDATEENKNPTVMWGIRKNIGPDNPTWYQLLKILQKDNIRGKEKRKEED